MNYEINIENGAENYLELESNYKRHYSEMKTRLSGDGIEIGDYNPNLSEYFKAFNGGWLVNYVVRFNGKAIGHSNVYITTDMHNGELIAQEDTIYILPEHRNGIGKKLVKYILADLGKRGVVRGTITPVTDLRVGKIWKRMGFKETATLMTYNFKEAT